MLNIFRRGSKRDARAMPNVKDSAEISGLVPGDVAETLLNWSPVYSEITRRRNDVKTLRTFIESLGALTDAYAKGLKKIAELPDLECDTTLTGGWKTVKQTVLKMSGKYEAIAHKIHKRSLIGISECKHQIRTEQERLSAQTSRLLSELHSIHSKHDHRKKKYFEATEKAHGALMSEQKARAEGMPHKKLDRLVANTEARIKDAKMAYDKYRVSLSLYQASQRSYLTKSKQIIVQLEALETMRHAVCGNQIKTFCGFRTDAAEFESKLAEELTKAIDTLDAKSDDTKFKNFLEGKYEEIRIAEYTSAPHHGVIDKKIAAAGGGGGDRHSSNPKGDSLSAVAIHPFQSEAKACLKLKSGDVVRLTDTKTDKSWWTGTIGPVSGRFPSGFVRRRCDIPDSEAPVMVLGKGTAVKDFKAKGAEEMSLTIGDELSVTAVGEGWYVGSKDGTSDYGIFPEDHVELKTETTAE